jgi:hypothetical protein
MRSPANLLVSRTAWFSRLVAISLLLFLLTLTQASLLAQQGWPQNPQYGYGQFPQVNPYAGQYQPNQQSAYAQQPYPGSMQQYDQGPGYGYNQGYPPSGYDQAQPPMQPLTADQLEQLVAPIALYPDTLVAQILAAATYPAQVVGADHWLQAQGYVSPDQIAYAADAQPWDPSVKALTAFPQVLAMMDQNLQWTTDLGNAYYNQPQDVLETVQVLRQRAQGAGTLQSNPQEEVNYDQGYIELAPPNPQVVYVPVYNPWDVYGEPVSPYPGFSLLGALESFADSFPIRYGLGVALSAFSHTTFGWMGWALDWLSHSILFHHSNYISHSTTVANWGFQRNGYPQHAAISRPPGGYNRAPGNYNRPYPANRSYAAPSRGSSSFGNNVRPALQNYAYNHPPDLPGRPQNYARSGNASGFYGRTPQTYAGRPGGAYSSPQQAWRAPSTPSRPGEFSQRSYSYSGDRAYSGQRAYQDHGSRSFDKSYAKPEHNGGFHLFGGGHKAEKAYGGYKAPKSHGGGKGFKEHSHGGGHSGGHHSGGHRR